MPLAPARRSDAEFAFPERVLGRPVQEHRRVITGGSWGEDFFEGGAHRGAFMPPPQQLPFQKRRMTPPPPSYSEEYNYDYDYGYDNNYDTNYDYDYSEGYMAPPPPPPPMMPRGHMMRRSPIGGMGPRGGYFQSVGGYEETRYRSTPPPTMVEEMTSFRRSPAPPSPMLEEMTVFRGSTPPPPAMVGRRGMAMRGYAAGEYGATTTIVGQRALAGEVISEEITIRPIGYEVWEEQIEVPVVTPIMQTVIRQDPMIVEKRITQETSAPMVVQEQGMAAAATIVESSTAAPTIVQEMGATATATVVQEMGMTAPATFVQEGYSGTVSTGYAEPRMYNEWETRAPTIVREMDSSLPPIAGQQAGYQAPIVVDENRGMGMGMTTTTATTSMRPPITVNEGGYGQSTFEQGMGMPGGIGAAPVPSNMGPPPIGVNSNAFGGPADLNNLGEPKARGFKRLRQKMHRH